MKMNDRSSFVRLASFLFPLIFLLSVAFPRYALSWTKEVIEAAHAVANGTATPKQQAIAFENNKAINEMALKGEIPKDVYHANQSSFEKLNNRFVSEAATENGLTAKLQQTPPGKVSQAGTDTDVLLEKGKSGKPITSEQIANTTKSYNRKVDQFLQENGVRTGGNQNWARKTDTDFMPVPSHTTPEEFAKIAAETNKGGGTMYKDPKAAEVEAQMRGGQKIDMKDADAYVKEMQTLAKDKLNQANELDRQAREIRRTSPQNEAQAKSLEAEAQLKRSQAGKYIERIDKVGGKLAEQHGVVASKPQGPAAESVSAVSKTRGPETAKQAANVGVLGEHSLTKATQSYAENLGNIAKANPELAKAAQEGIAKSAANLSPSQKGELIGNLKSAHGDEFAKGVAKEMAGKTPSEASSRKPAAPAGPSVKAPAGEPAGPAAAKASLEPAAKGQKSSVEPSSVGKTTTAESSAPKGERGPAERSATNKPSTPEEWRRWNEQRVPESVRKKGPGIPESNTGRDFVKGLPKHPTDPTLPAEKPFGSGMTPEQKAVYDKMIKEGVPHRAPPGKATTAKPSGSQGEQPFSEPATEPAIKGDKPSAKSTAEPKGKPAGQVADVPKGKGPTADVPDNPKGRGVNTPEGKPPGKLGKGLEKVGKGMIAVDILSGAEDFKEAAKKGDVEGMKDAAVATADSFTGGAKGTYDVVTTKLGDAGEVADKEDYTQKKVGEEVRQQLEAKARRMGASKEAAKEAMDAYEKGDKSKFHDLVKELQAKGAKDTRTPRPVDPGKAPDMEGDDTAWDRTKEVGKGMAERVKKAGKFLDDTRKDLTEIGTGLADKDTRDAVIEQVKENTSIENIRAGLDARDLSNKADADRAAARRRLADKLVEQGASRDEVEKAVSEWDKGDRHTLDALKERIEQERSTKLPGDAYDPRDDPNLISKGAGRRIDIAQADESGKEFQQVQGGGARSTTKQSPQHVTKQPESYTTDPGKKPDTSGSTQQPPFSPYPPGYPPEGEQSGVRTPWEGLVPSSSGRHGKTTSGSHSQKGVTSSPPRSGSSSSSGASSGHVKEQPCTQDITCQGWASGIECGRAKRRDPSVQCIMNQQQVGNCYYRAWEEGLRRGMGLTNTPKPGGC